MKILTFLSQLAILELSKIKQSYLRNPLRYFIQIFRFSILIDNLKGLKAKLVKVTKFAFSGVGLFKNLKWL